MLSTGISELKSEDDIAYFRDSLCLSMTDEEAAEFFTKMIWKSLNSKSTQLNFFVHNVANRKTKRY
jgi:phosphatidylinositol-4-phosphate 3-kinase